MVAMWVAIVASVPIPFLSITEINSDSLICSGGAVFPCDISSLLGRNVSPTLNTGILLAFHFSYSEYTSNQLRSNTIKPEAWNFSPPSGISMLTVVKLPLASEEQHARK